MLRKCIEFQSLKVSVTDLWRVYWSYHDINWVVFPSSLALPNFLPMPSVYPWPNEFVVSLAFREHFFVPFMLALVMWLGPWNVNGHDTWACSVLCGASVIVMWESHCLCGLGCSQNEHVWGRPAPTTQPGSCASADTQATKNQPKQSSFWHQIADYGTMAL